MPTPRKRQSTGFTPKTTDEKGPEPLEDIQMETEITGRLPVLIEEIVPSEDPGPRFLTLPETQESKEAETPVPLKKEPRRHPRNVPKFSRILK